MADQIVQLRSDGKWELIGRDNRKATKLFDTQKEAVEYARQVAGNQESGIIVKGRDGKVVYRAGSVKVDKAETKTKADPAPKAAAKPDKKAEKEKKKQEKLKAKEAAKKAKEAKKAAKKKK